MGEILNEIESLKIILDGALVDANKFDNGNASAGVRVRKAFKEVMDVCKEARKKVSDIKKERSGKKK